MAERGGVHRFFDDARTGATTVGGVPGGVDPSTVEVGVLLRAVFILLPLDRLWELLPQLCRLVERLGEGVISESEELLLVFLLYSINRLGM